MAEREYINLPIQVETQQNKRDEEETKKQVIGLSGDMELAMRAQQAG